MCNSLVNTILSDQDPIKIDPLLSFKLIELRVLNLSGDCWCFSARSEERQSHLLAGDWSISCTARLFPSLSGFGLSSDDGGSPLQILPLLAERSASSPSRWPDQALGCDLYGANVNDDELEQYRLSVKNGLPEEILIKKYYARRKERGWDVKKLPMEIDESRGGRVDPEKTKKEYEEFLRDLEENPELRFNISLYRNKDYQASETASMTDGECAPSVPIEELLVELDLSEQEEDDEEDMVE